jgi:hypothetical protein
MSDNYQDITGAPSWCPKFFRRAADMMLCPMRVRTQECERGRPIREYVSTLSMTCSGVYEGQVSDTGVS